MLTNPHTAGSRPMAKLIGIAGGTASGKSWLAHYLERELAGMTAVVSQDWYYKDHAGVDAVREQELNFDHPDAFDTPLLVAHLDALTRGEAVEAPRYDYRTHSRLAGERLESAPLLVLEGILILHHPTVRRRLDHAVFVDTPADLRLVRRLRRDVAERSVTLEETLRLYETFVRPMHEQFVQPSSGLADHVWRSLEEPTYPAQLATKLRKMAQ